jgi:4'-phosphopantetheinyl transferase
LPAAERGRVARIKRPARADAVALSLALARRALAAATGLPPGELRFDRTCPRCGHPTHGRPRLVPELVHFSVARSERWTAVAVAPVVVGVDVEDAGRAVAAHEIALVLSAAERRWQGEDRLGLWVMKEAVGKAMGLGIVEAEAFSVVGAEDDDIAGWRTVDDPSGARWSVTRVDVPDAALAVAVAGEPRSIRYECGWCA